MANDERNGMETKIAHLQMIQAVITRLAGPVSGGQVTNQITK